MNPIEDGSEPQAILDREAIEGILPHREPFLMIDEILELNPGKCAVAVKHVRGDEDFFRGHFPGQPLMPGVLITESLAQTGACALLSLEEFRGRVVLFAGIDRMRFRRPVVPGDSLRLEVTVDRVRGPVGKGSAVATVAGEVVAEGTLTFAVADPQKGEDF